MATPYADIYNLFLSQIQDYDILDQCVDVSERDMLSYLHRALASSQNMILRVSGIDLSRKHRDDNKREFEADLPDEIINLLVTGMEYYWIVPKANNTENLRNVLNTKDFTQFSPANLLFRLREARDEAEKRWKSERRAYAQRFSDLVGITKLHGTN